MKLSTTPLRIAAVASLLVFPLSACGDSADSTSSSAKVEEGGKDTLVVAGVPSEESSGLEAQFDTIGKLIKAETGKDVTFQNATDYAAVIEGLRADKIDIAMMGPFSYVIAGNKGAKIEPLGAVVDAAGEKPGYYSIGWVKSDSDIKDIKGFAGKKVCFVDVASTSGYLYPSAGLLDAEIDPKTGVEPIMAGGHDASLLSINSGQCDAGFAYEAMQDQLVKSDQLKDGDVKEVWRSEKIAGSPMAINTNTVDADTVSKLKAAFKDKANKPYLVKEGICSSDEDCKLPEDSDYGFAETSDSDYDGVRKVCELTEADACKG